MCVPCLDPDANKSTVKKTFETIEENRTWTKH